MTSPVTLYEYAGIVRSVYDGDTLRIDVDLGFGIWRFNESLRLLGINAPEMRGATLDAGKRSRDALRERVLGRTVTFISVKDEQEKYGRYLAVVYDPDGVCVNEWLVQQGLAVPYMLSAGRDA